MNSKILAIAIVTVVVAAGAGAYVMMSGNTSSQADIDASLSIYGNADNDYKIDSEDIAIVNKIISGELSASDHPLADANCDGNVDSADITLINEMIQKKNGITIYVHDDAGSVVGIEYPLQYIVPVGTNLISTIIQIGGADTVVGYTKTNYGISHGPVMGSTCIGGSIFDMNTDASLNAFMSLDASIEGGVDAVISQNSVSYLKTCASYLENAGVTILRFNTAEGLDSIAGALTIGYILGQETEGQSIEYAQTSYRILSEIEEKLKSVKESDVKTSFSVTMGYYISGIDSDYTGLTALAGSPTVSTLTGSGSTKINDGDEYYLQWNADYIISYRTLDYSIDYTDVSTGVTLTPEETWEKYMEYFKEMDCYENMVYINTSMPVVCRIAYLAEIFYPEIFGEGYGDSVHQEFVDRFMSYLGDDFDVSEDMTCVITYDMVKNKI